MSLQISKAQKRAAGRRSVIARIVVVAALAASSCIASAQIPNILQAGQMAESCSLMLKGTGGSDRHADCATRIAAFIAGWRAGVQRGLVHSTVKMRPKNGATNKEEVVEVLRSLVYPSTCLGDRDLDSIIKGFIDYVAAVPSRSKEVYGDVLAAYFLDELCEH
ncbi:hypothetical protein [Variovorax sp. YR266]|jgi:hypothetical protein|uniref:hypothetical protein n=1 Tax=Variovorax sp. YR266 TaxID=1884386 RepID=UPI00115F87E9|nr:hypothetical protein [Variovorax sp. YR266]